MEPNQPQEIELKLIIVGLSGDEALKLLRRSPSLARRQTTQQWLENRYFDTQDAQLHLHRCALRLRQTRLNLDPIEQAHAGSWIQTFKTAGHSRGGLSQRGEWETPVANARLDREALRGTAWEILDPNDQWFPSLQLHFETRCLRTLWPVKRRDGTYIEVALDTGQVQAGGRESPFVELELELKQGSPASLFELAEELAARVPCLPSNRSKAERGQALWADRLREPIKAHKPSAPSGELLVSTAIRAMAEMLDQFTRNLENLMYSDAPELVHQARVGWRRWRSLHKLLRAWLPAAPDIAPLRPLLDALGHQRNLDVACTETLPSWKTAWQGEAAAWLESLDRLQAVRGDHRNRLRDCLAQPQTGLALIQLAKQLWLLEEAPPILKKRETLERLARWHRQMGRLLKSDGQTLTHIERLHEARLLAKRIRYGTEALASALPAKQQRQMSQWLTEALAWQTRIGQARDAWQAAECLQTVQGPEAVVYFLKGVGAAMERSAQEQSIPQP